MGRGVTPLALPCMVQRSPYDGLRLFLSIRLFGSLTTLDIKQAQRRLRLDGFTLLQRRILSQRELEKEQTISDDEIKNDIYVTMYTNASLKTFLA